MLCQTRVDKVPGAGVQGSEVIRVVVPGAWGYPCAVVPYDGVSGTVMSGTGALGVGVPGASAPGTWFSGVGVPGVSALGAGVSGVAIPGAGFQVRSTAVQGTLDPGFEVPCPKCQRLHYSPSILLTLE
jgi:hypothetical protein